MRTETILICDDDESIIQILYLILNKFGFNVVSETNSANFFSTIVSSRPDLILLDYWMPDVNGGEIIKILKSNPATSMIPVILVSASTEAKKVSTESGADGFIAKPFQIDELIALIETKLNSRGFY